MSKTNRIEPKALKERLHNGQELGLIDVREAGEYGEGHLFYATNIPYSRLERDIKKLVPNTTVQIVLIDKDDGGLSDLAAKRLLALGYTNVQKIAGGLSAWRAAGLQVFAGVNVPSKAFGEIAEHQYQTPHVSAQDLSRWQNSGLKPIVIDGRPFEEYKKMNIPEAICCPNGELALRIDEIAPDSKTPIVINCAGRTRSIIGAQTLINLGIKNPIYALENGTQGWYLADQKLEHGSDRRWPDHTDHSKIEQKRTRAQALAQQYGIETISADTLNAWWADQHVTTYLCDVRTPQENQQNQLPGAISAPGGQLIQATDQYVAIRGARLVLWDNDGVRAPAVAHWLYQLGWDVSLLEPQTPAEALKAPKVAWQEVAGACPLASLSDIQDAAQRGYLIDLRDSASYRDRHIRGAHWQSRRMLGDYLKDKPTSDAMIVLIGDSKELLEYAAIDCREYGASEVRLCLMPMSDALTAQLTWDSTPESPPNEQRIDYLYFVHDRHDGNKDAARQYLAWELNLVNQLDEAELSAYRFTRKKN
jgi:rhodanese-related sulfurtransferase